CEVSPVEPSVAVAVTPVPGTSLGNSFDQVAPPPLAPVTAPRSFFPCAPVQLGFEKTSIRYVCTPDIVPCTVVVEPAVITDVIAGAAWPWLLPPQRKA